MFELRTAVALIVLVFLIFAQILYLLSRIKIVKKAPPIDNAHVANLISKIQKKQPLSKSSAPLTKNGEQHIKPDMFKQFQENIDQSKKEQTADQEKEVVLSLSQQNKEVQGVSKPPVSKEKSVTKSSGYGRYKKRKKEEEPKVEKKKKIDAIEVGSIDSLFDDMNEPAEQSSNLGSVNPKPRKSSATISDKGQQPNTLPPLTATEVLTSEDLEPDQSTKEKEAGLLLSTVQKSIAAKNYGDAAEIIQHWLQSNNTDDAPADQVKAILLLKAECEFGLQNFNEAAKTGQLILKKFFTPVNDESLAQIEHWNERFTSSKKQELALHFLFTALNEYRVRNDNVKLDQTYLHIEAAYEQMEDWPRLIQTLQNHMGIKKNIKDYEGQLSLLDHLGKLLYDQGDAQGSKRCYEQSITIKSQMVKA